MVTPLMYILSSIDTEGEYGKVYDLSYLPVSSQNIIQTEAFRICDMFLESNITHCLRKGEGIPVHIATATMLANSDVSAEINKHVRSNAFRMFNNSVSQEEDDYIIPKELLERTNTAPSLGDGDHPAVEYVDTVNGCRVVSPYQYKPGTAITLEPCTIALMTRIFNACLALRKQEWHMKKFGTGSLIETLSAEVIDLDTELLYLEGRSEHIYSFICRAMQAAKAIEPDANRAYHNGLMKIKELRQRIYDRNNGQPGLEDKLSGNPNQQRMHEQANEAFWTIMLTKDWLSYGFELDKPFDKKDLEQAKQQLTEFGIFGFVNPVKTFNDFNSAVLRHKVAVDIKPETIEFLDKVLRSGGVL